MKKLLTLAILGLSVAPLAANAALVNHYSFNDGTGTDSVGGFNGTITGGATVTGGALTTGGASGDYLSLPGTFDPTVTGDFSIQIFATATNTGASYATLFSFAASTSNFLLFNPRRDANGGATANQTSANFQQSPAIPVEKDAGAGSALLADGVQHDLLLTYVSSTGVASIYNNGTFAGSLNVGTGFNFSLAATGPSNGINGHSPFGDGSFIGSTDDFRIYNQAVTATQAAALDTAGANASDAAISALVPEPSTWMALFSGAGLLGLSLRRRSTRRA